MGIPCGPIKLICLKHEKSATHTETVPLKGDYVKNFAKPVGFVPRYTGGCIELKGHLFGLNFVLFYLDIN